MKLQYIITLFLVGILLSCEYKLNISPLSVPEKYNTRYKYFEFDTFPKKLVEITHFDDLGNITENIKLHKKTGLVMMICTFKYDSLNQCIEETCFDFFDEILYKNKSFFSKYEDSLQSFRNNQHEYTFYYKYNSKGLKMEENVKVFIKEDFYLETRAKMYFFYNSQDSLVKEERYDTEGKLTQVDTFYYFDGKKDREQLYPKTGSCYQVICGNNEKPKMTYSYEYKNEFLFLDPFKK